MLLSELTASARRLALVGLAKNTGKTVAMTTILGELAARGRVVGVTSVGRDGEERDALDARIAKPRIRLRAGSLVATTDQLLRASGLPHVRVSETALRTPLGRVVLARLEEDGAIEVAGPGTAHDVGAVSAAMLALGAEQVLVDGALDRRAGAAPAVADAVVLSTGAALHRELEEVVRRTREAAALLALPRVADAAVRALAAARPGTSLLVREGGEAVPFDDRLALTGEEDAIAALLRAVPDVRHVLVGGALCEPFVAHALRAARGRELVFVVADGTRVFLPTRGLEWHRARGARIEALAPIDLRAITVNPLAPASHRLDAHELREAVAAAVAGVPVLDVLDPAYAQAGPAVSPSRAG